MYEIKKIKLSKKGGKWATEKVTTEKFDNYRDAKSYYSNVVTDNGGRTHTEYGCSVYGAVSSKTFYSPSGLLKSKYVF